MRTSDSIQKVSKALVAAQAELDNVTTDAVNPHFRSRYASLPTIIDMVRPVLAKHGLALVQMPLSDDGCVGVETIVLHDSGEYLSDKLMVRPSKADPQGAGSAITYCRRYALAAFMNLGQEDDDGNESSRAPQQPPQKQAAIPSKPSKEEKINAVRGSGSTFNVDQLLKLLVIAMPQEWTMHDHVKAIEALQSRNPGKKLTQKMVDQAADITLAKIKEQSRDKHKSILEAMTTDPTGWDPMTIIPADEVPF